MIPPDADILPPSDDHIFKTLLTHPDAKPVLISVVSAVIERPVSEAHVRNAVLPSTDVEEKEQRLDVNCSIDGGDQVDVEMQCSRVEEDTSDDHDGFINKSIYYLTDLHSSQKSMGVDYHKLVRTYQVTFCAYPIFKQWPDFVSRFSMRRPTGEQVSDQINMVVIEMSKLRARMKTPVEDISWLEAWTIFFSSADDPKNRDLINNLINTKEEIKMASELLMEISKDERERAIMRSRRMFQTDQISNILTAERRDRKEGETNERLKNINHMHQEGFRTSRTDRQRHIGFANEVTPTRPTRRRPHTPTGTAGTRWEGATTQCADRI
jgi:predicted transposase/invertase (TIGR01784 family)